MVGLAAEGSDPKTVMINANYPKAHSSLQPLSQKAHLSASYYHQGSAAVYRGAAALPDSLPKADWALANRSCNAD